ncbi:ABC transporter substrate-binding protein [Dysgonomonas macrotermitis]|uniref:Iron complex transport system substrate-binding protein n=1 Tax=Dysgonomonas macrotermitis TaxID=1346286 RepID=A0A1M4YL99_9BACT|nr:ABC transporter substrate-binding protein [Dysgonomonas macrotermitis]SHF06539.1 iron complex transport system substrate-binding protein [Dysgonomonas macrotermitis]
MLALRLNKFTTLILLLSVLILGSCSGNKTKDQSTPESVADTAYTTHYAKGFKVKFYTDYKEVTVVDPWDSTKILQRYILVDKKKDLPKNLPQGTLIRTPLTNVVAYSTIHCATLNELGMITTVKGVCEPRYIDIDYIKDGVENGSIADLGQAANPVIEKIVDVDPEAILATPIQGRTYGSIDKTGIPIIETPDYMEPLPLGRAEWIRFYSLFFDSEEKADSLFNITESNYNSIKEKVAHVAHRPTVFLDRTYSGVWYISGGESFISRMLGDAGATYAWYDNGKVESVPLPFEQILEHAGDAEYWLIKYNNPQGDLTYSALADEYKPYSYFGAYKNRNIYECNAAKKTYYEDLPIHPDYILQDFAYIFHPDLFPGYVPRYYEKMKE